MAQGNGPIMTMKLADFPTTLTTGCTIYGAFDRDNVITFFVHFGV
jgi:hypothetical protein